LFGSFGVVVGLMLVLGVAAIVELGSVENRAQYLGTNSVPAAQTIGTIETAAASFRRVASRPTWWWPALVGEIQGETHRTVWSSPTAPARPRTARSWSTRPGRRSRRSAPP